MPASHVLSGGQTLKCAEDRSRSSMAQWVRGSIQYSMTDEPRHGGMNEAVYVKAQDENIHCPTARGIES